MVAAILAGFLVRENPTSDWQILVWMWEEGEYLFTTGMQSGLATVEIGGEIPEKARHGSIIQSKHSWLHPLMLDILLQRYLLIHDHSCSAHNSQ